MHSATQFSGEPRRGSPGRVGGRELEASQGADPLPHAVRDVPKRAHDRIDRRGPLPPSIPRGRIVKVQSPQQIALARKVLAAHGWCWDRVRSAGTRRDDGVIVVPRPTLKSAEKEPTV